jgi:peptidoglycan hydrolase-like protein with peptidoglycan-binding domain
MKIGQLVVAGTAALALSGVAVAQQRDQTGSQSRDQERMQQPRAAGSMQQGMDAQTVREAQQALKDKGHDPGPIDGMWGPQTQAAVKEFQEKEKLQASGRLDQRTLSALGVEEQTSATGAGRSGEAKSGSAAGASSPAARTPGGAQSGSSGMPSSPSGGQAR